MRGVERMRSTVYESLGLGMLLGSGYFFYRCIGFLAAENYLAGLVGLAIGVVVIRTGVELSKLAILVRRDNQ